MVVILEFEPGAKTWVAILLGRSRTYGFEREFIGAMGGRPDRGESGTAEFVLDEDGVYEICELDKRRFVLVKGGGEQADEITRDDAVAFFKQVAHQKKQIQAEIDARIARFNTEGGFTLESQN